MDYQKSQVDLVGIDGLHDAQAAQLQHLMPDIRVLPEKAVVQDDI